LTEFILVLPAVSRQTISLGAAWEALGTTLAALVEEEGLVLSEVRRSFVFDILIARSCREIGATLVSRNSTDLSRIAKVFSFDFVAPYPIRGAD